MRKSKSVFRCEKCQIPMRSRQSWVKDTIRKRFYICPNCGESFTTTEFRDSEQTRRKSNAFKTIAKELADSMKEEFPAGAIQGAGNREQESFKINS